MLLPGEGRMQQERTAPGMLRDSDNMSFPSRLRAQE
jgi:hypothetical protein